MTLELIDFIKDNLEWETILQEKPYGITIKRKNGYILFMYNQIESNFNLSLVRECRGLILRESGLKPVCVPFFKFFNAQESSAAKIDWVTARVLEKLDGSIIKCWFDNGQWHISTNGTIDASDAELMTPVNDIKNYHDLFISADNFSYEMFDKLNINYTYCFEIVSPFNRIVVSYKETKIYFLGARDNNSLMELNIDIGINKPKEYNLTSLNECLEIAKTLSIKFEGYVICDKYFNRIKIKGFQYVSAHHLRGDGIITKNKILDLIRSGGQDDFISIFSEYEEMVKNLEYKIISIIEKVKNDYKIMPKNFETRKDMAVYVNKTFYPSAIFSLIDKKVLTIEEFIWKQNNDKILSIIEE